MKMDTTICAKLHYLADQLRHGAPPAEVAAVIDQLAQRNLVALPDIHPGRDDLAHWQRLPDQKLRGENGADGWNLAAGLHEEAHRRERSAAEMGDEPLPWLDHAHDDTDAGGNCRDPRCGYNSDVAWFRGLRDPYWGAS